MVSFLKWREQKAKILRKRIYSLKCKMIWCLLREGECEICNKLFFVFFFWGGIYLFSIAFYKSYIFDTKFVFWNTYLKTWSSKSLVYEVMPKSSIKNFKDKFRVCNCLLSGADAHKNLSQSIIIKIIYSGGEEYYKQFLALEF